MKFDVTDNVFDSYTSAVPGTRPPLTTKDLLAAYDAIGPPLPECSAPFEVDGRLYVIDGAAWDEFMRLPKEMLAAELVRAARSGRLRCLGSLERKLRCRRLPHSPCNGT